MATITTLNPTDNGATSRTTINGNFTNLNTDKAEISDVESGWNSVSDTWTYSSVDDPTGVITVPSDATTKYSKGMRISFVNGGNTIYGIITAVTATTITFLHEIDPTDSLALNLMANSAITSPQYSTQKAPFGFPLLPTKWTVKISDTTDRNRTSPTQNTWYGGANAWTSGSNISINIPIGAWDVCVFVNAYAQEASSATALINVTLSSSDNSESDSEFTTLLSQTNSVTHTNNVPVTSLTRNKILDLVSKTTYYVLARTTQASQEDIRIRSSQGAHSVKATCAYL